MRTLILTLFLVAASQLSAGPREDLRETVAACTGRMSAQLEFAWLISSQDADRLAHQRLRFVEILDALGPSPDAQGQMMRRIEAKMAHARLLTAAHFGTKEAYAVLAKRHARIQVTTCLNMLLDS